MTKKILSILMVCALTVCMSAMAYATPAEGGNELIGLIEVDENARWATKPTEEWNFRTKDRYDLRGSSDYQTLYSACYFTGASKYYVYLKNCQSTEQTVKCRTLSNDKKFEEKKIPGHGEIGFYVSPTEAWYLEFTAGYFSDGTCVSGYVKAA